MMCARTGRAAADLYLEAARAMIAQAAIRYIRTQSAGRAINIYFPRLTVSTNRTNLHKHTHKTQLMARNTYGSVGRARTRRENP